jgi:hypothetical protein
MDEDDMASSANGVREDRHVLARPHVRASGTYGQRFARLDEQSIGHSPMPRGTMPYTGSGAGV